MRTVCFTGHRHISPDQRAAVALALQKEIQRQIELGATCFRTGGAVGFDTMAALEVLRMKRNHPQIRLELILPCPSQPVKWDAADVRLYNRILQAADGHRYVSPGYYEGVMQLRNRALVDGSDVCIAYLRSAQGGSGYTAAYALRSGLEFVSLCDGM